MKKVNAYISIDTITRANCQRGQCHLIRGFIQKPHHHQSSPPQTNKGHHHEESRTDWGPELHFA
jgi:hypothetical protein